MGSIADSPAAVEVPSRAPVSRIKKNSRSPTRRIEYCGEIMERLGYGYSSLRSNFLCGFQICKP